MFVFLFRSSNDLYLMKPIYLQLDELGPWIKFTTPPVSPRRRVLSTTVNNNRRVRTVYMNSAANESIESEDAQHRTVSQELPHVEHYQRVATGRGNGNQVNVKTMLVENSQFNDEVICESQHVTHQYFPYRQTAVNFWQKSFRPLPSKNAYPYTNKAKRNYSLSPNTKKNYVFWNQRKLVGIKIKRPKNIL